MFSRPTAFADPFVPYKAEGTGPATPLTVETIDNHIRFYTVVDSDRCLAVIRALYETDARLRTERATRNIEDLPPTPIWLHVQSWGGDVFAAFALADQIKTIRTPVYAVVEGCAASAATLITCACPKRFIRPSAFMLIHEVSTFFFGKYEELKDEKGMLDALMGQLVDFYAAHTCARRKQIRQMLKRDFWMTAPQCIELGFADTILA